MYILLVLGLDGFVAVASPLRTRFAMSSTAAWMAGSQTSRLLRLGLLGSVASVSFSMLVDAYVFSAGSALAFAFIAAFSLLILVSIVTRSSS